MAVGAAPLREEHAALGRSARQDVQGPLRPHRRGRVDVGDQVSELGVLEGGPRDSPGLHRLGHLGTVIPHGGGEEDRRAVLFQEIEVRPHDAASAADLVADDTALFREELPAGVHPAGRIEVVDREQKCNEVPRFARVQLGLGNAELRHPLGHARCVVPHGGREIVERARAPDAAKIRRALAADPVDRVTLDAALRAEDPGSCERILRRAEQRLGERDRGEQKTGDEDDSTPHRPLSYSIHEGDPQSPRGVTAPRRTLGAHTMTLTSP